METLCQLAAVIDEAQSSRVLNLLLEIQISTTPTSTLFSVGNSSDGVGFME
jgi:hypothetical protein